LPNGQPDLAATLKMLEACEELPFTFHRAFDLVPNQVEAMKELKGIGVKRILSSGGAETAFAGIEQLKNLQQLAGDELCIIAGGGIEPSMAASFRASGLKEFHGSFAKVSEGPMKYRPDKPHFSNDFYQRKETDAIKLRAFIEGLK